MDPLTIVSLVSNIIQLVDAATSAATKCYEIYKLGAPKDDLHLASVTEHLSQCYTTLSDSLQVCSASKLNLLFSRGKTYVVALHLSEDAYADSGVSDSPIRNIHLYHLG